MNISFKQIKATHRDLMFAALISIGSAIFFYCLISRMTQELGQFTKYQTAALQYLNGRILPERLLDFSPLYLGVHIIVQYLPANPEQWINCIHIILLSLTNTLLFFILRRHTGIILSLAGASAFALGKSVIIYGYIFEPEPFMMFFLTALVFFSGRKDFLSCAAAGLSLALCMLTRPTFAPLVLIVPLYYRLQGMDRKEMIKATMIFLAPVILGLILISARNYQLQGSFSPVFMSPGTVFFDGNNPLSYGVAAAYPNVVQDLTQQFPEESDYQHAIYRMVARKATGSNMTSVETNRFWAAKAANYILDSPGHFLSLTAHRIFYLFHEYRWHDLYDAWSADQKLQKQGLLFIPFAIISSLALVGIVSGLSSWRAYFLLYAVFLIQTGLMALTYATDRQRVGIYPFFIFFAAIAITDFCKRRRGRLIAAIFIIILALCFSNENSLMKDNRHGWKGYDNYSTLLSEAAKDRDTLNFKSGVLKSAQALAFAPWTITHARLADLPVSPIDLAGMALNEMASLRSDNPSTQMDRALLLIEAARFDESEIILNGLQQKGYMFEYNDGRLPEPAYYLGRIAFLRGKREDAVSFMQKALHKLPGNPVIMGQLYCLTGKEDYADAIFRYYDNLDAYFYLGRACIESGRPEQASKYLELLCSALPEYQGGQVSHAAALGKTGQYRQAAEVLLTTIGENTGMVPFEEDEFMNIFQGWAKQDRSPDALYWHGIILRKYGRFSEAITAIEQAEKAGHPKAAGELLYLKLVMSRMSPE